MSTERQVEEPREGSVTDDTLLREPGPSRRLALPRRPFLLVQVEGLGAPREYPLQLPEVVIGRSRQVHLAIESHQLSRRHCSLRRVGPDYVCADLDSVNGVWLNGVKVHSAVLRDGDELQLGDVVFVYREGEA